MTLPVACRFGTYGLSAHADRMQMVSFIEALEPRTVVLVHGDDSAKDALGRSLRCQDVITARDGTILRRDYPSRAGSRGKAPLTVPAAAELDLARARQLLGPAGGPPVQATAVAEAWFGQPVDRATADRFARVLEGIGLVRRDDDRRDRLWVLGPQETHLFPEEAALEEELKRANPKGRLLEMCARMRIDPPQTETEPQGPFYRANMSLGYQGETLMSGPRQAASKKTAEQLAAQALLELLSKRSSLPDMASVSEEDLSRLQLANPKGQLLEWCTKKRWASPQFEQQGNPRGYQVRAVLHGDNDERFCSGWYVAASLKAAEQAAAADVLNVLRRRPDEGHDNLSTAGPERPVCEFNAPMALNELKQNGILESFGYDAVQEGGPSHQPVFSIVAWTDHAGWAKLAHSAGSCVVQEGGPALRG